MTGPTRPAWGIVADATGIGAGTQLLDLGCGSGGFCALAALRGAAVHGIDGDPQALDAAARRVPHGDFRLGLIEALPWPDDTFDVVTAFNALQYALDIDDALREARRVARPGGHLAICKWGPPAANQLLTLLTAVGAGTVPQRVADPVERTLTGVAVEAVGEVPAPVELADDHALVEALCRAGVHASTDAMLAEARRYRTDAGQYRFDNRLRYWILRA